MADINSPSGVPAGSAHLDGVHNVPMPADDDLIELVELLFFAYRDFTGEADAVLDTFSFGRAHHRVLHFVNRRPGLRVADLLDILRITKQSLARVLKELVDRDFIVQAAGEKDRRERRLFLTAAGKALAVRLARLQIARIRQALDGAGVGSEAAVKSFLARMVEPGQRDEVAAAIAASSEIEADHTVLQLQREGARATSPR
jgi:DNA-binding MarR family transcriptional regulator